jgi:aspartyl-tRNA(Asn)/glutamyl-tRNA(Gln) amidotransferase subunit C
VSLTRAEVEHVAQLAHLGITEEEADKFGAQLSQILDYFSRLSQIDTEGVRPTSHTLPLENVSRRDEPRPAFDREAILANAPLREGDYFRVRKVLE